jgi:uncharacterized membrane protein YozB (DUF420 family)
MGATTIPAPSSAPRTGDHANAHLWLIAALAVIVAGFWGSFFKPMGARSAAHNIHGISATLWVVMLISQSWLVARRQRAWHKRMAYVAVGLLAVMVVSGLQMIAVMLSAGQLPIELARLLSFIDLITIAFLLTLVTLALLARRTPQSHRRYMAATVLLAFPPSLTRLFAFGTPWPLDFMTSLNLSFFVVEAILITLIVRDVRAERRAKAYPLSLAVFGITQLVMLPASQSAWFAALGGWYAAALN